MAFVVCGVAFCEEIYLLLHAVKSAVGQYEVGASRRFGDGAFTNLLWQDIVLIERLVKAFARIGIFPYLVLVFFGIVIVDEVARSFRAEAENRGDEVYPLCIKVAGDRHVHNLVRIEFAETSFGQIGSVGFVDDDHREAFVHRFNLLDFFV